MKRKIMVLIIIIFMLFIGINRVDAKKYLQKDEEVKSMMSQEIFGRDGVLINSLSPDKIDYTEGGIYNLESFCTSYDCSMVDAKIFLVGVSYEDYMLSKIIKKVGMNDGSMDGLSKEEKSLWDEYYTELTGGAGDDGIEQYISKKINESHKYEYKYPDKLNGIINYPEDDSYDYYLLGVLSKHADENLGFFYPLSIGYKKVDENDFDSTTDIKIIDDNNVKTNKEVNPKTGDIDIRIVLINLIIIIMVTIVSYKKIRKIKKNNM
ncbi:MAG: hypothetical protein IJ094_05260 [Bacilli bacterium]|nr:hypothetical protein [Bacilli bacterium]